LDKNDIARGAAGAAALRNGALTPEIGGILSYVI
jgi:hypothetical protein